MYICIYLFIKNSFLCFCVQVCELRGLRLDQEELFTEFQKGVDALKKESEVFAKKERGIDKVCISLVLSLCLFLSLSPPIFLSL